MRNRRLCVRYSFPSSLGVTRRMSRPRTVRRLTFVATRHRLVYRCTCRFRSASTGVEFTQSTGVFVPENYRVGDTVDLVLFLRGYDIKRPKAATSVEEYWNSPSHPILKSFLFRQEINKSGKNVIPVPCQRLGPHARKSAASLSEAGGVCKKVLQINEVP